MKYEELEALVLDWAKEKEILSKATPLAQANKTLEEVQELIFAITLKDKYNVSEIKACEDCDTLFNSKNEIKDALGDILVTIIIGAHMQELNLLDCLESAYNVIKKRTGKMIKGQFVKD